VPIGFKKSILKNGMALLSQRLPQFHGVSIGVWVAAGARHEVSKEEGLSHFLEHMMFKGTANRSAFQIAEAVDKIGGEFNAFTSKEYTCFHFLVLHQDTDLACEILSDVLCNSTFSEEEIERERKVILQEIDMVGDNPEEVLYDEFYLKAFNGHALAKPILGTKKSVGSFKRKDVLSYFQKHYTTKQMMISVSGNIEHKAVEKKLNALLKDKKFAKKRFLSNLKKPQFLPGSGYITKDTEQTQILLGFPSLPATHKDRFILGMMNTHLGGGMSSRLFQEIRENRGLAYSVYSAQSGFSDAGIFSIYVGTSEKEGPECMGLIGKEVKKLKTELLPEKTLRDLKHNIKNSILISEDSVEGQMMHLARSQIFFNRYITLSEVFQAIDKVTSKDIQKMAKTIFDSKKMRILSLGALRGQASKKYTQKLKQSYLDCAVSSK